MRQYKSSTKSDVRIVITNARNVPYFFGRSTSNRRINKIVYDGSYFFLIILLFNFFPWSSRVRFCIIYYINFIINSPVIISIRHPTILHIIKKSRMYHLITVIMKYYNIILYISAKTQMDVINYNILFWLSTDFTLEISQIQYCNIMHYIITISQPWYGHRYFYDIYV